MNDKNNNKKRSKLPIIIIPILLLIAVGSYLKIFVFKSNFTYSGTLEATKVDLSAQLPSTIGEVKVLEGAAIKSGQVLVSLACEDFKVASELANENFQRNHQLYRSGSGSQETLDQMKNRKKDADLRLEWCSIKSPIQGSVLNRYHEPGEWVGPGTKLLTLANIRDIWTYIYVPQPDVSKLKVGMNLVGSLPEVAGRTFSGKIVKINDEAEFTPKNVQTQAERTRLIFGVKVSFLGANEDELLKPGMTIELKLPFEKP